MDHWMRKRKWWWTIMFWAVGVTLTNSYLIYKKLCEEENKQPAFSHYEFLKEVAEYWMNPVLYNDDVIQTTNHAITTMQFPSASTISTLTTDSTIASSSNTKKRARHEYVSDESLKPDGKYGKRLFDPIKHFPVDIPGLKYANKDPLTKKTPQVKCNLHWWFGEQSRVKIMYCPECDIKLCIDCYKTFHTVTDLVGMKDKLQKRHLSSSTKKKTSKI